MKKDYAKLFDAYSKVYSALLQSRDDHRPEPIPMIVDGEIVGYAPGHMESHHWEALENIRKQAWEQVMSVTGEQQ